MPDLAGVHLARIASADCYCFSRKCQPCLEAAHEAHDVAVRDGAVDANLRQNLGPRALFFQSALGHHLGAEGITRVEGLHSRGCQIGLYMDHTGCRQ
jgi:hypothetical protein